MSNAYQQISYEEGLSGDAEEINKGYNLKPLFMKYLKVSKDCGWGWYEYGESCVTRETSDYVTYNKLPLNFNYFDDGELILDDGSFVFFDNPYDGATMIVSIDTNGFKKKPNRYGYDLFSFQITNNGKFLPSGAPGTTFYQGYCSKNTTSDLNGIGCTYKALTDENYWKNLP